MTARIGFLISVLAALLVSGSPAATPKSEKKGATPTPEPPPCTAAPYRQFDFWLGEWEVTDSAGKPAGRNRIVSVFNGCALQENWESVQGGKGTSLNVYDAVTGRWHQTWVDDHGGLLELEGRIENGKMVLIGGRPSVKDKGTRVVHRITWAPVDAGKVHQHWEASKNEGRTWTTVFDGIYTKRWLAFGACGRFATGAERVKDEGGASPPPLVR